MQGPLFNSHEKPESFLHELEAIIQRALEEDLGSGDLTTRATVPEHLYLNGQFIAKQSGIIAGLQVAEAVFRMLDATSRFSPRVQEGNPVEAGQTIALINGRARALLSGERVALNFLQRMSGIATRTHQYVKAVAHTGATILDTRKTVPGLRLLDKWAVRLGGGRNHRAGLYDMVLIKENHITAAGGLQSAVEKVRHALGSRYPVEVEVRSLEELKEALRLPVDRILLDNMSLRTLKQAVQMAGGRIPLEASGNVSLQTVREIAETGVDFISVGELTHSVRSLDISFLVVSSST